MDEILPVYVLVLVVALQAAAIVLLWRRHRHARNVAADLRRSSTRSQQITDLAPVMIWTATADARLDYVNQTCVDFSGLSLEQLLDNGWLSAVHPDDLDRCTGAYTPAIADRRSFSVEYRILRADGRYRWVLDRGVPIHGGNGSYIGYIGCTIDITERKDAEEVIRASHREIQQLAGRLIEAQDVERARIARDLHDDVSQQVAGLSIAFSGVKRRVHEWRGPDVLDTEFGILQDRLNTLAESVRHVSHDLHPTVLQHAGLVAAMTTQCAELEQRGGLVATCRADGDLASLDPAAALCLYRIGQEALRNVVVHADASSVHVGLHGSGDSAGITITDDGKGFDLASVKAGSQGLGLVSMSERVRLAGGSVKIDTEPGGGTRVTATIPAGIGVAVT